MTHQRPNRENTTALIMFVCVIINSEFKFPKSYHGPIEYLGVYMTAMSRHKMSESEL